MAMTDSSHASTSTPSTGSGESSEERKAEQGRGSPEAPPDGREGERREKGEGAQGDQQRQPDPAASGDEDLDEDGRVGSLYEHPTLRLLLKQSRSSFQFDDLSSAGPSAFGDHATVIGNINLGHGERKKLIFADPVSDLTGRCRTFIPPRYFSDLQQRLRRNRIVGIAGLPKTGRMTAACVALAEHRSTDRVRRISPPGADVVPYLREDPEVIEKGFCYIIRIVDRQLPDVLRNLEPIFEERDSSAIVIRDLRTPDDDLHRAELFHQPPAASVEIFRRHLNLYLDNKCVANCRACAGSCREAYISELLTESVSRSIALMQSPGECAQYAERIAAELPRGPAVAAMLPSESLRRREEARRILLLTEGADEGYQNRSIQLRRALRIAYAVFAGQPMASVSDGAGLLLGKLDRLFAEPVIGRPALLNDLPGLLGQNLCSNWHKLAGEESTTQRATRVAQVDAGVVAAILDVAWNDFDNSRVALVEWVDELASHPEPGFSECAAVAAGIFALHDFDHVYSRVIRRWARDRRRRVRQTAAAAMVATANLDGSHSLGIGAHRRVRALVNAEIEGLARSASSLERDTAAMVWGLGYVSRHPSQAARALTIVAANAAGRHADSVSNAVDRLFGTIGNSWTIGMLSWWLDSNNPALRTHAAQAFLEWVERVESAARHEELLTLLNVGPTQVDHLALLWRFVLLDPRFSVAAWRHLAGWLKMAAVEIRLAEPMHGLARRLAADPAVRSRLTYWLSRGSTSRSPQLDGSDDDHR
ncbi:hypothetical protein ACIBTV_31090 [Micromonospora sp. NPDC049366]|uniref:hypothetical protein n=1 Tax=Micromonospora sp. NPDC049366 TaxID=3364271 RepID=UPI0037B280B6